MMESRAYLDFEPTGRNYAALIDPNTQPANAQRDLAVLSIVHHVGDHPAVAKSLDRFRLPGSDQQSSSTVPRDLSGIYFREMSAYRSTTSEEKDVLFAHLDAGVDIVEKLKGRPANAGKKQSQALLRAAVAYKVLMQTEQPLVLRKAKEYRELDQVPTPLWELVQEGVAGLSVAIRRFDRSLGNEFSTFAVSWIKQNMRRYFEKDRLVGFPENADVAYRQLLKLQNRAATEGQTLSYDELAEKLGEKKDGGKYTAREIALIIEAGPRDTISLFSERGGDDEDPQLLIDFLPSVDENLEAVDAGGPLAKVIEQEQAEYETRRKLARLVFSQDVSLSSSQRIHLGLLHGLPLPDGYQLDLRGINEEAYRQVIDSGRTMNDMEEVAECIGLKVDSVNSSRLKAQGVLREFIKRRRLDPESLDKLEGGPPLKA